MKIGEVKRCLDCSIERVDDVWSPHCGWGPLYRIRTGWGERSGAHTLCDAWRILGDMLEARGHSAGGCYAHSRELECSPEHKDYVYRQEYKRMRGFTPMCVSEAREYILRREAKEGCRDAVKMRDFAADAVDRLGLEATQVLLDTGALDDDAAHPETWRPGCRCESHFLMRKGVIEWRS